MDDVTRIVTTYVSSESTATPEELLNGIKGDSIALLDLVKALGPYLTSLEGAERKSAVGLLSGVLAKLPKEKINRQSTRVLTTFYCEKLDDFEVIGPSLQGLVVLSSLPTFGTGETTQVCNAIFQHINMKALVQSIRFMVFTIIDILMANHRTALKEMGDEFVVNYCLKIAEGEKDPRNLLVGFSLSKVILLEFDVKNVIEELFDVTFCYFPITYKPPPKDPYNISTEDLRVALRDCLCATPLFAKQAMPLLLDKLVASGGDMKKDTLKTLTVCFKVYGHAAVMEFAKQIWEGLKVELLYTSDTEIEAQALLALESFVGVLYPSPEFSVTQTIRSITEEMLELLKEPEKSKAKPATNIIRACFKASASIAPYVYEESFSQLCPQYHRTEELSIKGSVLEVLAHLLQGAREVYTAEDTTRRFGPEGVLDQFKDDLMGCFSSGIKSTSSTSTKPALEGYLQIVHIPEYMSNEEISYLVQSVNNLIISEDASDLRSPALAGLSSISKIFPKALEEITLPLLFSKLPDSAPALDDEDGRAHYRRILASLTILCVQPVLFEILVVRITAKLDLLCYPPSSPSSSTSDVSMGQPSEDKECNAAYAFALLNSLLGVLNQKVELKHPDIPKYIDHLVPRLFSLFVCASLSPTPENEVATDPRLLVVGGKIVEVVTQTLSAERQDKYAASLFAAYQGGKIGSMVGQGQKVPESVEFKPMVPEASEYQKNLIVFFSSVVIALRPEVQLPVGDFTVFLTELLKFSIDTSNSDFQVKHLFHIFSSIVNKKSDDSGLATFFSTIVPAFWETEVSGTVGSQMNDMKRRARAIQAWVWLTRGLLVRSHALGFEYLAKIFSLFEEEKAELSWQAARALAIIAEGDGEKVLSKQNHTVIRLLYRQKFFNQILPKILEGYTATKGQERQTVYLVALSSIIKIIPRALCISELPKLLPLLLRSLDLPDADLKANVMDVLLTIAEVDDPSSAKAIETYAETIVRALLKNAVGSKDSNEHSRCSALKCLRVFPDVIRYDVLHPVKPFILKEIAKALDDKKRSVRKEAVDTRARWFLYQGGA